MHFRGESIRGQSGDYPKSIQAGTPIDRKEKNSLCASSALHDGITFGNVVRENYSAGSRSAEKGHSGSQNRRGRRTLPRTLRSISASIALQESKRSMESAQRSMESAQRSMESAQRSWKACILYCGPMDAGQDLVIGALPALQSAPESAALQGKQQRSN